LAVAPVGAAETLGGLFGDGLLDPDGTALAANPARLFFSCDNTGVFIFVFLGSNGRFKQ
jgi:hypothetical protein